MLHRISLLALIVVVACGGTPRTGDAPLPEGEGSRPTSAGTSAGDSTATSAAMTFFVTSTGNGEQGGNLGGISGADEKCQSLATGVGAGDRTWHAYLSTDNPQVHARDRIGTGPWSNQAGKLVAADLASLHRGVAGALLLTESGQVVPSDPLDHDILTGSTADGRLMAGKTCSDWTDSTDASGGQVGHADIAASSLGDESWNSQHDPQCSQAALKSTAGSGRIYCFAID